MLEQGYNEERKLKIGHQTKDGTTYIPFFHKIYSIIWVKHSIPYL